jgi:hypothetical protein
LSRLILCDGRKCRTFQAGGKGLSNLSPLVDALNKLTRQNRIAMAGGKIIQRGHTATLLPQQLHPV